MCLLNASSLAVSGLAVGISGLFLPLPATSTSNPIDLANSNNPSVTAGSSPSDPV